MVASAHPLASQAGLAVLRNGGNAFDATVAVASTLNVVEPYMSGMGGIGLALAYVASEGRVRALNFSGRVPSGAKPELFTTESQDVGPLAPMVPGNVKGWLALHGKYGTKPRAELFQDAIDYAANGFPLTAFNAALMAANQERLSPFPTTTAILYPHGEPLPRGTLFRQPQLAESLGAVAQDGESAVYEGQLGERIVAAVASMGGLLSREDLATYEVEWTEPVSTTYRGYTVNVPPPNSSAFQVLHTLNILEGYDDLEDGTPDTIHRILEAIKIAVADRLKHSGDPDHTVVPLERLISKEYAAEQRAGIRPDEAAPPLRQQYAREHLAAGVQGIPEQYATGLTTHFAVADGDGNMVTVTQTLGHGFGSGVIAGDTGVFLNNMILWFDIDAKVPGPNLMGPGKRVDFCVAPTQVLAPDGSFRLSIGTPGGYGILQTTLQMLHHFVDGGMNVQEAIEAPRFRFFEEGRLLMESRISTGTVEDLRQRGHTPETGPQWDRAVGGGHGIEIHPDSGALMGGADPRRDGIAAGW